MDKKIVVFHPMQQHSFKTAEALIEAKMLYKYYTSVYYNENKLLYRLLELVLGKGNIKRMKGHNNDKITPFVKTYNTFTGLFFMLLSRIDKTNKLTTLLHFYLTKKMGKKVAKDLIKENVDLVIGFDSWSYGLIKELKKRKSNIKVVMDYTSLYAEEIVSIVNTDISLNPNIRKSYNYSMALYSSQYIKYYHYELKNADYYISASSVADNSILKYGVKKDKIYRCTYGTNFKKVNYVEKNHDQVTFIYIGRLTHAKGVHYLLNAFENLHRDDFKLLLIGEDIDNFSSKVSNKNVVFVGLIHHDKINEYLKISDVAISASIYDGFSLALLESAAYNLPIICTKNTGISDFIQNYKNGFVVNPFQTDDLIKRIEYFLNNKEKIKTMSLEIGSIIKNLTWEQYNIQINNILNLILKDMEEQS